MAAMLAGAVLASACGVPSAADTDPPIRNGKRVNDGAVADLRDENEPAVKPRVLVVGDPRMASVARSVVERQVALAVSARSRVVDGCSLLPWARSRDGDGTVAPAPRGCSPSATWVPTALREAEPDLALVLLSEPAATERELAGAFVGPCDRPYQAWYQARLADLLEELTGRGARAVVVPAHAERSTTECLAEATRLATAAHGAAVLPDDPSTQALVEKALRASGLVVG